MGWGDIVKTISGAAPLIGSLFGPAGTAVGAVAGAGLKLVATALGVEPTQDAIAEAIATDPAAAEKLKEFEMNHQLEIQKLYIQQLGMELADIADARKRQVEHEKATGKSDINLYVLAWVIMGGFIGAIIGLVFMATLYPSVNLNNPLLNILFGSLSTDAGMVVGYFFGSSRGSENKTDLLYNSTPIKKV